MPSLMTLEDAQNAVAALDLPNMTNEEIKTALRNILSDTSTAWEGGTPSTLVLYNGQLNSVWMYEIAGSMQSANPSTLASVDTTIAGRLINSSVFQGALGNAFDGNLGSAEARAFIFDPQIPGQPASLWSSVSDTVTRTFTGDVVALTPAAEGGIYSATELPNVVEYYNNYGKINGIDAEFLRGVYESKLGEGLSEAAARQAVGAAPT